MPIHGNQPNLNSVNPYAAAAEKAVAAPRSANGRKKLLKSATNTERLASPEEASLLAKWMDALLIHRSRPAEYHASPAEADPEFG